MINIGPMLRHPHKLTRLLHTTAVANTTTTTTTGVKLPNKHAITHKFQFDPDSLTTTIQGIITSQHQNISQKYKVNGWIHSPIKKIGNHLYFTTLRDTQGDTIQLIDKHEPSLLSDCNTIESCVQVQGTLALKKQQQHRQNTVSKTNITPSQQYELVLDHVRTLNKANIKPSQLITPTPTPTPNSSLTKIPPEYRYLHIRTNKSQQSLLKKRYQINHLMRLWLHENQFMEIETPILFKPTPEGAREYLVPTRQVSPGNKHPMFYSLTQSPQQYKQLLMASGISRYYQFAKCFRDEDLRKDRQPEFTQLDMEMSFAKGEQIRSIIQDLIIKIWSTESTTKKLFTWDQHQLIECHPTTEGTNSIKSMTYNQVMTTYGIDKPNLIAPILQIKNLTELTGWKSTMNPGFPILEVLILKNVLNSANSMQDYKTDWEPLLSSSNYKYRAPIGVPIQNEMDGQNWYKHIIPTYSNTPLEKSPLSLSLSPGDLIFISDRQPDNAIFENPTPMGRLRQLILNKPNLANKFRETPGPQDDVVIWVTDFPLFSPVEDTSQHISSRKYPTYSPNQYVSTHHPFTMVKLETLDYLKNEPLKCIGQHYDLVMNGVELGGGSQRVHDFELQDYIFKHVLKIDNSHELFGHLLEAFQMGTPPHSGFAIGFDRMCSMLFNKESIRDVIAFPKSITGSDLLVKSPATVDDTSLRDYHISQATK